MKRKFRYEMMIGMIEKLVKQIGTVSVIPEHPLISKLD
jgi:hypothetical protein